MYFFQYGFVAWLLSTCVGLLLSFSRYTLDMFYIIFNLVCLLALLVLFSAHLMVHGDGFDCHLILVLPP